MQDMTMLTASYCALDAFSPRGICISYSSELEESLVDSSPESLLESALPLESPAMSYLGICECQCLQRLQHVARNTN